jgi:hypothetical protein
MKRQVAIIGSVVLGILVVATVFWAKGRSNVMLEGTLQRGFEQSDFYPNGDCSRKPFWWQWPNELDGDLNARWKAIGTSGALHVKVRCNVSSVGMHGHLGRYLREIRPLEIISTGPVNRCR